jgi:hypothetical protein
LAVRACGRRAGTLLRAVEVLGAEVGVERAVEAGQDAQTSQPRCRAQACCLGSGALLITAKVSRCAR